MSRFHNHNCYDEKILGQTDIVVYGGEGVYTYPALSCCKASISLHSLGHVCSCVNIGFFMLTCTQTHAYTQVRVDGKTEVLCRKAFASLHGVTLARVRRIAQASSSSICAPRDQRGKHKNRPWKITGSS